MNSGSDSSIVVALILLKRQNTPNLVWGYHFISKGSQQSSNQQYIWQHESTNHTLLSRCIYFSCYWSYLNLKVTLKTRWRKLMQKWPNSNLLQEALSQPSKQMTTNSTWQINKSYFNSWIYIFHLLLELSWFRSYTPNMITKKWCEKQQNEDPAQEPLYHDNQAISGQSKGFSV